MMLLFPKKKVLIKVEHSYELHEDELFVTGSDSGNKRGRGRRSNYNQRNRQKKKVLHLVQMRKMAVQPAATRRKTRGYHTLHYL